MSRILEYLENKSLFDFILMFYIQMVLQLGNSKLAIIDLQLAHSNCVIFLTYTTYRGNLSFVGELLQPAKHTEKGLKDEKSDYILNNFKVIRNITTGCLEYNKAHVMNKKNFKRCSQVS